MHLVYILHTSNRDFATAAAVLELVAELASTGLAAVAVAEVHSFEAVLVVVVVERHIVPVGFEVLVWPAWVKQAVGRSLGIAEEIDGFAVEVDVAQALAVVEVLVLNCCSKRLRLDLLRVTLSAQRPRML